MTKSRLEAFTDAVIAIIMTLLVLQLEPPKSSSFEALFALREMFVVYLISFIMLAIYWNNHHHLFQLVQHVNGKILWANNFLIFSLSLFPFATAYVSEHLFDLVPEFLFGVVILLADVMYFILYIVLLNSHKGPDYNFDRHKEKMYISMVFNVLALVLGYFIAPILIIIIDSLILLLWFIPSKHVEIVTNQKSA